MKIGPEIAVESEEVTVSHSNEMIPINIVNLESSAHEDGSQEVIEEEVIAESNNFASEGETAEIKQAVKETV